VLLALYKKRRSHFLVIWGMGER